MKRKLLIYLSIFFPLATIHSQGEVTLSAKHEKSEIINACKTIKLLNGFSYKAEPGKPLVLMVNPGSCDPYNGRKINLSNSENYIHTRTFTNESGDRYLDAIQYFDGLGRPVQTVQRGFSPTAKDIVNYQQYDALGREAENWLPSQINSTEGHFKALQEIQTAANNFYHDSRAYSKPEYEKSPLNRVLEIYNPGERWINNPVKTNYLTNNSTHYCYRFISTDDRKTVSVTHSGNYADGELYVTETIDESGNKSYEFKDKLGQVVLTRQTGNQSNNHTYYVYDSFGNLRMVIPPKAAIFFISGTWTENNQDLKDLAFVYKYDERNRCIAKKLPGCDWVYYVYDKADRLILTQDGEQRAGGKNEWTFTIPDSFGRTVITGICKNTIDYTANPLKNSVVVAVPNNITNTYKGYNINGIALSSPTVLTANYYDSYDFMGTNNIPSKTDANFRAENLDGYGTQYSGGYKGLLTGTLTARILGQSVIGYQASVMYYDYRGRLIQTKSQNHFNGFEKEYMAYTFTGQLKKKQHTHTAPNRVTQTEEYDYMYDHAGRLLETKHRLNGGSEISLAQNTYDDIGRLESVTMNNQSQLKSTYAYNIRSWTTGISNPHYWQNMDYTLNGNVDWMEWGQNGKNRRYAFTYDHLSRLEKAVYTGDYGFSTNYTYDFNGNIISLRRLGLLSPGGYSTIDDLTYNYGRTNQLISINDNARDINWNNSMDFKDYSKTTSEYLFNANGAIVQDKNKGIQGIVYNYLNMPAEMVINNTHAKAKNYYTYSATGERLQVISRWNPSLTTIPIIGTKPGNDGLSPYETKDYLGNKVYENSLLKKILLPDGYIEDGNYYFYIQDHLGNNRIVANASGQVMQSSQYYPFGMSYADDIEKGKQPYKYNGKEMDENHGLNQYDYHARQYDPVIGRFTTVDPLAEKYYNISPYAYVMNNPLKYIDPDGKQGILTIPRVAYQGYKLSKVVKYGTAAGGVIAGSTYLTSEEAKQRASEVSNHLIETAGIKASSDISSEMARNPGYDYLHGKNGKKQKDILDALQASTANEIVNNISGKQPNGDPSMKRPPKGGIPKFVITIGLGAAAIETTLKIALKYFLNDKQNDAIEEETTKDAEKENPSSHEKRRLDWDEGN